MYTKRIWLAVPAILALALTACSGSSSTHSGQSAVSSDTRPVKISGSEPRNPLIPANTNETGGGSLVDMMFSGLVYYDKDGKTHNEVAESIDTTDKQTYTVKLKKGWKFSDGTDLKAHNFTDAWKLATTESMSNSDFFSPIKGTNDHGTGDLSGVKLIDDYTFTIELKQPTRDFLQRIGYRAFFPLSDSTLKDPKEGGEHPVTNGPYMPDGKDAWKHQAQFSSIPNPHYIGERKPKNTGFIVTFYSKPDTAYRDLQADQLDIGGPPQNQITTYKNEFKDRSFERPSTGSSTLAIPEYVKHFSGDEGKLRRQAISYAIDRKEIGDKLYHGIRTPAKEFSTPPIPGYNDHLKGNEVLTYDAAKAKDLWAQADAISPWSGTFFITSNTDGGSNSMLNSVINSVKNTLNINVEPDLLPDFKTLLEEMGNKTLKGGVMRAWAADYPSQINYLAPIYATNAGSNYTAYSNPTFDGLLKQAQTTSTDADFYKTLDQAQEILLADLPEIPLWYRQQIALWSNNIKSFDVLWNGTLDYWSVEKK